MGAPRAIRGKPTPGTAIPATYTGVRLYPRAPAEDRVVHARREGLSYTACGSLVAGVWQAEPREAIDCRACLRFVGMEES